MATTCTKSTAVSTPSTPSSTSGRSREGTRGPTRRPMTSVSAPAAGRRGLFREWRQALGLDEAAEVPPAGGTAVYLHARGVRGGVTVSVTATVFDGEEDTW